jgi:hypothetical protein
MAVPVFHLGTSGKRDFGFAEAAEAAEVVEAEKSNPAPTRMRIISVEKPRISQLLAREVIPKLRTNGKSQPYFEDYTIFSGGSGRRFSRLQ